MANPNRRRLIGPFTGSGTRSSLPDEVAAIRWNSARVPTIIGARHQRMPAKPFIIGCIY
jgi:hypothetical protein